VSHRHPPLGQVAGRAAEVLALAQACHRLLVPTRRAEPLQGGDGGRPADTVHGEPGVALEVHEGRGGAVAQDSVDPPRVEAQAAEAPLQGGHIVAPQHRGPPVQETLAQAVAGLDQRRPGLRTANPVDAQAPLGLEGPHRRGRALAVVPGGVAPGDVPQRGQAPLDVANGIAAGSGTER